MHNKHFLIEGVLVGVVICEAITIYRLRKPSGVLRIDRKTEKDLYRFEIDDLDSLAKKKIITLIVDNNANLSQQ